MSSLADRAALLDQQTKPSLEGFIAWLETKDPTEQYDYHDSTVCACGQYAEFIDTVMWGVINTPEEGWKVDPTGIWDILNGIACSRDAAGNWTFGHTLKVAREMLVFEKATAA